MNIENIKNKWDKIEDYIDLKELSENGTYHLRRRYLKKSENDDDLNYLEDYKTNKNLAEIVAKGITAYFSDPLMSSNSLWFQLKNNQKVVNRNNHYTKYFVHKMSFLKQKEVANPFEHERKSEAELLLEHLEDEKLLMEESNIFFTERMPSDINIVNQIKNEVNFYFKWIKAKYDTKNREEIVKKIPEKHIDFWMQFTKKNPKADQPYLSKDDVDVFLKQAFCNEKAIKTFNPSIAKKELYHAAWLFYDANKNIFKKSQIAEIMKQSFPEHFPHELKKETENIRDGLNRNKRIFHKI